MVQATNKKQSQANPKKKKAHPACCFACELPASSDDDLVTVYDGRHMCPTCFPTWSTVCSCCGNRARKLKSSSDRPLCRACEAPPTKACHRCGAEPHPTPQPDGTHLCVSCFNEGIQQKKSKARASSRAPPSRPSHVAPSQSIKPPTSSHDAPADNVAVKKQKRAASARPQHQARVTPSSTAVATTTTSATATTIIKPKCVGCAKTARSAPFQDGYFYCTACTPPLCANCNAVGHPTPQPDGTHLCKDCYKAARKAKKPTTTVVAPSPLTCAGACGSRPRATAHTDGKFYCKNCLPAPGAPAVAPKPVSALKKSVAVTKKPEAFSTTAATPKTPRPDPATRAAVKQAVASAAAEVDVEMVALIVAAVQAVRQRKA